jgi:hypothetical protein
VNYHTNRCQELERAAQILALTCGVIGLIGSFAAVIANFVGIIVVEEHNPISETISKLAIGEYAWIQDVGLDFYAAGVVACAVGLYAWNLSKIRWKLGALCLVSLGVIVILIAEHNQYAGQPENNGQAIHRQLVYAFGILFALSTLLFAFGLRRVGQNWYRFSMGMTIGWVLLAPVFYYVPTAWDGAYERFLGLLVFSWTVGISWLLIQRGVGNHQAIK